MSSAWWLGWRCLLGLSAISKTTQNLMRTRECVLNLPSISEVEAVNRLARTTGSDPVPDVKLRRGYYHVADKFGLAGLTALPGQSVAAPRVRECPLHLEARVAAWHGLAQEDAKLRDKHFAIELCIQRVFAAREILYEDDRDRIDPDKWRPLIMSFQHFYGLAPSRLLVSELAKIPEAAYRM